jgi:hypothetical protein
MHFFGTVQQLVSIPEPELDEAFEIVKQLQPEDFKYRDINTQTKASSWWRTDGWLKADPGPVIARLKPLALKVASIIIDNWPHKETVVLSYFNVSVITPNEYIEDHVDPKLANKLSYRVLVPLNPDIYYKYHWYLKGQKVYGQIKRGHAYHFNNNDIHAAYNVSDQMRYALMYDFTEERLFKKFAHLPDWRFGLVADTANKNFLKRHEGHVY